MTALSLACADAFGLLREDLYTHLEEADCLAKRFPMIDCHEFLTSQKFTGNR